MRRFCYPLLLTLALTACRIEQTPQRYIDHQLTPAEEIAASESELRSRLYAMTSALQRRSGGEVAAILHPHPEVHVVGPGAGENLVDPQEIAAALDRLAGPGPGSADQLSVRVGPRNNVAWFHTEYTSSGHPDGNSTFRFSGVFVRLNGEWRLMDGHLSRPASPPSPELAVPDSVPEAA